jgi:clan AA aspartic protease
MIHGYVDANLEPMIQLAVQAETGEACEIDALLDTGFNGFLTLPSALVASLGYPWVCDEEATLADGSTQQLTVHAGKVIWDGQLREIEVACPAASRNEHAARRAIANASM